MSNLFFPQIFFRMFVVFFIFEILLIVSLVVAYYFELDMTKDQVKKVVEEMFEDGEKKPSKIIEEKGWIQISDEGAIKEVVLKILENFTI